MAAAQAMQAAAESARRSFARIFRGHIGGFEADNVRVRRNPVRRGQEIPDARAEMYIVLDDRRERVFAGCNLFPDRAVAEIAGDLSFADAVAAEACVLVLYNLVIAQSVAVDG